MLRKSFRFWLMPLLLGPAYGLALDIGEVQVSSALNQIFDARIPLPKLTPEELNKVSVKLAPQPLFKEFGLERTRTLTKLVFSVEYNPAGEVYVRIVSTEPIREPSLGLLLEFGWPRGKTFREFTIFLDPVQRLAKPSSDRTKTVLNEAPVTSPPPVPVSPPVADPAAPDIIVAKQPTEPAVAMAASVSPAASANPVSPISVPASPPPVAAPAPVVPEPTVAKEAAKTAIATVPTSPTVVPTLATVEPTLVTPALAPTVASSPLPVEVRPSPQTALYKPGDSYGPVAAGEGLWKIALKLRPDAGITPEQMMQALFRANPQAFTRSGIDGLKIGSTLRIPSLHEIASFSGSAAAKQLAETEETTAALLAETTKASGLPAANSTALEASGPISWGTKAFPLAPVIIEPIEPMPRPLVSAQPVLRGQTGSTAILTPVAAAPLLYEAVSDVMLGMVKVPGLVISNQIVPDMVMSNAGRREARKLGPVLTPVGTAATGALKKPLDSDSSALNRLNPNNNQDQPKLSVFGKAPAEERLPMTLLAVRRHSGVLPPKSTETSAAPAPGSLATMPESPVQALPPPAVSHPPIDSKPDIDTASAKGPAEIATMTVVQYGPVVTNERLWDIATKLRPDESISKDVMMKALVKANPQAFAKTGMDQMKVGAILRVPTLEEIVIHTGSPAAKLLLEQHSGVATPISSNTAEAADQPESKPVVQPSSKSSTAVSVAAELKPEATTVSGASAAQGAVSTEQDTAVATETTQSSPAVSTTNKEGRQYGPVVANERLWDIATKLRPDESISKDVMMKALVKANPQAFAKTGMDQMKVGAILRVPTLEEIVIHTGSPAAKQLLEQRQTIQSESPQTSTPTSTN